MLIRQAFLRWLVAAVVVLPVWLGVGWAIFGGGGWGTLGLIITVPVAFLSLVPSGSVSAGLYDVIEVISAVFPFDPALRALEGALDADGPSLWAAIGQLAALALVYGTLARIAVRRFI